MAVTADERGGRGAPQWSSGGWAVESPNGLRSFDPFRIADLEYQMWVAYYRLLPVLKPDVLPVCRDAVRERVRSADPLCSGEMSR